MAINILGYGPPQPPAPVVPGNNITGNIDLSPPRGSNAPGRNRASVRGSNPNPGTYRPPGPVQPGVRTSGDPRIQDGISLMGYQRSPQPGVTLQGGAIPNPLVTPAPTPTPLRNYYQPMWLGPRTSYGTQRTQGEGRYIYRTPQQVRDEMIRSGRTAELGNTGMQYDADGYSLGPSAASSLASYTNWYNQVVAPWLVDNPDGDVLLGGLQPFDPLMYADSSNPYAEDPNAQNSNDAFLQAANNLLMALGNGGLGPSSDPALEQRLAALEQQQQPQIPAELLAAILANNQQNDEQQMYSSSYFGGYY